MDKKATVRKMREAGLKITPQRRTIIEVLAEINLLHPPVSLIHKEAQKKIPSLSLSTTYATVNELRRLNMVTVLDFGGGESRCETDPAEHINLICRGCGRVLDYRIPFSFNRKLMSSDTGFLITGGRMEYYGFCKECVDKGKPSNNP